jgi:hypothetical protein
MQYPECFTVALTRTPAFFSAIHRELDDGWIAWEQLGGKVEAVIQSHVVLRIDMGNRRCVERALQSDRLRYLHLDLQHDENDFLSNGFASDIAAAKLADFARICSGRLVKDRKLPWMHINLGNIERMFEIRYALARLPCRAHIVGLDCEGYDACAGMEFLGELWLRLPGLRYLNLCGSNCIDGPAAILPFVLALIRQTLCLKELHLSFCRLGDAGLTQLAQALDGNRSLQLLTIEDAGWGGAGERALARLLDRNTSLRQVYIGRAVMRCGELARHAQRIGSCYPDHLRKLPAASGFYGLAELLAQELPQQRGAA